MNEKRAVFLLVCILCILTGCSDSAPGPGGDGVWPPLTIIYTCDTHGYLYPCDCDGGADGGMARRARYLGQNQAKDRILVDAGDVTAGA